jgi:methylenetetrahydrofolate dehydrogenase (NADP+)/methenyltetrahydrofolate cyclohydrolase
MSSTATPKVLDGRALAERIRQEHAPKLQVLADAGRRPRLVVVRVGEDKAAEAYLRGQRRAAEAWGIDFAVETLPSASTEKAILKAIRALNADPAVTGILLSLPLPPGIGARRLQHEIAPDKDVEGVHPENLGECLYGRYGLLPCTALAVMALIESAGVDLEGQRAVVVGHSEIVGKPVALLLLAQNATVTVCHKYTSDLADFTREADVLVVAVGKPGLIRADMVRTGAVVVDVGINAVPRPDDPARMRIVGDVDFDAVQPLTSAITPVPGGVGPVTVAMLLRNTVLAAEGMPSPDDPNQLPLFR